MKKNFLCPVCGFDQLKEPPYDASKNPSYEICPCCGFEFGYDDKAGKKTFQEYRHEWIKNGAPWFRKSAKPKNWNLDGQLKHLSSL